MSRMINWKKLYQDGNEKEIEKYLERVKWEMRVVNMLYVRKRSWGEGFVAKQGGTIPLPLPPPTPLIHGDDRQQVGMV